jgi:hypothetical protein
MKERPILFSGQMVNAIRDGRKRQTRRKLKGRLDLDFKNTIAAVTIDCPYGKPGDKLWCRETWAPHSDMPRSAIYRCDRGGDYQDNVTPNFRWRPSIFMPRWASRILLEITAVRVERLQDISDTDAINEGIPDYPDFVGDSPVEDYRTLWESINGPGSWSANPWVWVIEFKVLEGLNH